MSALSRMREADPERYDREYQNGTRAQILVYIDEALSRYGQKLHRATIAPADLDELRGQALLDDPIYDPELGVKTGRLTVDGKTVFVFHGHMFDTIGERNAYAERNVASDRELERLLAEADAAGIEL